MANVKEIRLGTNTSNQLNGGLCLNEETALNISQSPHNGLLNMCLDNGGVLCKRKGQAKMFSTPLGDSSINSIYANYKGYTILHYNTSLYKYQGSGMPTKIEGSSLSNNKSNMFVYNSILYIQDGKGYYQYDGEVVKSVVPYIPRVSMNRKADGSNSTIDESWNMLGDGFRNTFNGDGTSKVYKLSLDSLNNRAIKVVVNNVIKTLTTDYTVDFSKGVVTFVNAPSEGTNNVEITAYKTFEGLKENITGCRFAIEFSNRIFISGNPNTPNMYYAGGLSESNDASYFPQKYMYGIKGTDKAITGFKVHYNTLIVFKEDITCTVTAATGLDNTASFPIEFLNTEVGCDIPGSIQLINNNIVFANTYGGVNVIVSTQIPGEKSNMCISQNINGDYNRNGLLNEANLKEAISIDHDYKYYLCVNDKAYVLDYREVLTTTKPYLNRWFLYDNIKANCFSILDNELVYGMKSTGNLVKFINAKNDFGKPINAYWKSKLIDFGYPDFQKIISELYTTFSYKGIKNDINIKLINENGVVENTINIAATNTWTWTKFDWSAFNWDISLFDKTIKTKVRLKKIVYLQLDFSNNEVDQDLAIKNIVLHFRLLRRVK